ncbi:antitoxin VbhA family protein [Niallia taxi]
MQSVKASLEMSGMQLSEEEEKLILYNLEGKIPEEEFISRARDFASQEEKNGVIELNEKAIEINEKAIEYTKATLRLSGHELSKEQEELLKKSAKGLISHEEFIQASLELAEQSIREKKDEQETNNLKADKSVMKVKDLMALLNKCDPESEIFVLREFPHRPFGGTLVPISDISNSIDQDTGKTNYIIETGIGEAGRSDVYLKSKKNSLK